MFSGMLFVAVALCAGGLAIAGLAALLGRASRGTGSTGGVLSAPAQVLAVREISSGGGQQHWVKMQFGDGHQRELMATASQAEVMVRGQQGTVHWTGDRLTGGTPEVGRGPQDVYRSE
jgi:hypothetical protein